MKIKIFHPKKNLFNLWKKRKRTLYFGPALMGLDIWGYKEIPQTPLEHPQKLSKMAHLSQKKNFQADDGGDES